MEDDIGYIVVNNVLRRARLHLLSISTGTDLCIFWHFRSTQCTYIPIPEISVLNNSLHIYVHDIQAALTKDAHIGLRIAERTGSTCNPSIR